MQHVSGSCKAVVPVNFVLNVDKVQNVLWETINVEMFSLIVKYNLEADLIVLLLSRISAQGSKMLWWRITPKSYQVFQINVAGFISLRTIDHIVLDLCEPNQSSFDVLHFSPLSSDTGCDDGSFFWEEAEGTEN